MSKIAMVQALDDSAPKREKIKTVSELQDQIADLNQKLQASLSALDQSLIRRMQMSDQSVEDLRQTLNQWRESVLETQSASMQNFLDLAVLIEPILPTFQLILERQAAQDKRLATIEMSMSRLMEALPDQNEKTRSQPKLVSREDLVRLPSKVWDAKPPMFGKF